MNTIELSRLEAEVEQLLRTLQELRSENKGLRSQLARLSREKNLMHQHNQKIAKNVKEVIHSLKEALP